MKHKFITALVSIMLISAVFSGIGFAQTSTPTPTEAPDNNTSDTQADNTNNTTTADENESEVDEGPPEAPPGLQISAMLGKMSEDIDSSIERYALGHEMRNAESKEEREQILNSFLDKESNESQNAAQEQSTLDANETGADYKAAMNVIESRNAAENGQFAKEMAEKYNVSVNQSKVEFLSNNAQNMSGQEVSTLARSLAGPPEGANGQGPPSWAGPGGPDKADDDDEADVEVNKTVASEKLTQAEDALADARNDSNVSNETLAEVESDLEEARSLYEKAQNLSAEDVEENETETEDNVTETETENNTTETETEDNETDAESEEENESELEEERQDLYEEVYEISVDSIEELEGESDDADENEEAEEADDEAETDAESDDDESGPPEHAGGR